MLFTMENNLGGKPEENLDESSEATDDIASQVLTIFIEDDFDAINNIRRDMISSEGIKSVLDYIWEQYSSLGLLNEKRYLSGAIAVYHLFNLKSESSEKINIPESYKDSFLKDFLDDLKSYQVQKKSLLEYLKDKFKLIQSEDKDLTEILQKLSGVQFDESLYLGGYIVYKLFEKYKSTIDLQKNLSSK